MLRRFFLPLLLATILVGCSETEQPEPENIPDIPPGRAVAAPESGEPTNGPAPARPGRGRPER